MNEPIKVGDKVVVPFPTNEPWEDWAKEGRVIVLAPPYCIAVVQVDPFTTERVTCPLDRVVKQ